MYLVADTTGPVRPVGGPGLVRGKSKVRIDATPQVTEACSRLNKTTSGLIDKGGLEGV
jgi:hypothetical protein